MPFPIEANRCDWLFWLFCIILVTIFGIVLVVIAWLLNSQSISLRWTTSNHNFPQLFSAYLRLERSRQGGRNRIESVDHVTCIDYPCTGMWWDENDLLESSWSLNGEAQCRPVPMEMEWRNEELERREEKKKRRNREMKNDRTLTKEVSPRLWVQSNPNVFILTASSYQGFCLTLCTSHALFHSLLSPVSCLLFPVYCFLFMLMGKHVLTWLTQSWYLTVCTVSLSTRHYIVVRESKYDL